MDWHVVTYQYRGAEYFDSPLYRSVGRMSFRTWREARAWADAEHPELPDFKVLGIHTEPQIVTTGCPSGVYPGSWEARHHSDHNTDLSILKR